MPPRFAQGDTDELLGIEGGEFKPDSLSVKVLGKRPAPLGRAVAEVMEIPFFEEALGPDARGMAWIDFIGKAVLEPLKIEDEKLVAGSEDHMKAILRRNPKLRTEQFVIPRPDRPSVYVMAGTLLAPKGYEATNRSALSFQMSPDFSGSPFYAFGKNVTYQPQTLGDPPLSLLVGGGMIESFAFGGAEPGTSFNTDNGGVPIEPTRITFNLKTMVGISSMAVANDFQHKELLRKFVPEKLYWPVCSKDMCRNSDSVEARVFDFGDGGITDNGALLQMLQRGTKRLVEIIAASSVVDLSVDFCNKSLKIDFGARRVNTLLRAYFGFFKRSAENDAGEEFNQVFEKSEFQPLMCDFQKLHQEAGSS